VSKKPEVILDFEYSVSAVIPVWDNAGNPISSQKISKITKFFAKEFGGATVFPTYGCWFDDSRRKLVCEQNLVIKSLVDVGKPRDSLSKHEIESHMRETLNKVIKFLNKEVGVDLRQAAVLVEGDSDDMGVLFSSNAEPGPVSKKFIEKINQPDLKDFLSKFRF